MPSFLSKAQVYAIINRELPEGLYAYSPAPGTFYVTSEFDSYAKVISDTYSTMQSIYTNMFVTTADEKIYDFETMYFGYRSAGALSVEERRARILAKIRSKAFVALWDVLTFVASYVPEGTYVQVLEFGIPNGDNGWSVGYSEIGMTTILGFGYSPQSLKGEDADLVWTGDWEQGDPLPTGVVCNSNITEAEVRGMRETAYGYEIRIFDYELTGDALMNFLIDLAQIEPARSGAYLLQNLTLADYFLTVDVSEVNQFTTYDYQGQTLLVNCIANDTTQNSGYKGKVYSP